MPRHQAPAAALCQAERPSLGSADRRGSGRSLVLRAPGGRLRRIAQLCFSQTTCATVFAPILDELSEEYCEALAADDVVLARFARWRGYGSFWFAVAARLPVSLIKLFL